MIEIIERSILAIQTRGTKNTFFKKQSGEVIDNKGLANKNKPEQTEKQSGEVVENTSLLKKQS